MGSWEKHTKGIGLKLLQKFGFKGRLGANENGISSAVEVVVRPTNLGLGFGGTVEAVNLPGNKRIEAEWKGLESVDTLSNIEKSASDFFWKKGAFGKQERKFLSVNDFINTSTKNKDRTMFVVDMRHSENGIITDVNNIQQQDNNFASTEFKIGQELLYNVDLMSNMQETEVVRLSKAYSAESSRSQQFFTDELTVSQAQKTDQEKSSRLNGVVDELVLSSPGSFAEVVNLFIRLHCASPEEFLLLSIMRLFEPLIIGVLQTKNLSPTDSDISNVLMELLESREVLTAHFQSSQHSAQLDRQVEDTMSRVVETHLLPLMRRFVVCDWRDDQLFSNCDACLSLFRQLKWLVSEATFAQTVTTVLVPRLVAGISMCHLKELENANLSLIGPLHDWFSVLGPADTSVLNVEVRRKLSSCVSSSKFFLTNEWFSEEICRWSSIHESKSESYKFVISVVVPGLARFVREKFVVNPSQQDMAVLTSVLRFREAVPALHWDCLLAGEIFSKWLQALAAWLRSPSVHLTEVMEWCEGWHQFFQSELTTQTSTSVAVFNLAFDLIEQSLAAKHGHERPYNHNMLRMLAKFESGSYSTLLEMNMAEAKAQIKLLSLSQVGIDYVRGGTSGLSFREVVESLAERHGRVFLPRPGKLVNDRQVYFFGRCSIYLDERVVFVQRSAGEQFDQLTSVWTPVTLEDLLPMS